MGDTLGPMTWQMRDLLRLWDAVAVIKEGQGGRSLLVTDGLKCGKGKYKHVDTRSARRHKNEFLRKFFLLLQKSREGPLLQDKITHVGFILLRLRTTSS